MKSRMKSSSLKVVIHLVSTVQYFSVYSLRQRFPDNSLHRIVSTFLLPTSGYGIMHNSNSIPFLTAASAVYFFFEQL